MCCLTRKELIPLYRHGTTASRYTILIPANRAMKVWHRAVHSALQATLHLEGAATAFTEKLKRTLTQSSEMLRGRQARGMNSELNFVRTKRASISALRSAAIFVYVRIIGFDSAEYFSRQLRHTSQIRVCVPTKPPQLLPPINMAPPSTEQNFRANLSQFRWARGTTDDSQTNGQQQPSSSGNPFARFYNAVGGAYVPLRSGERSNEEEAYFALSRWER